MFVSYDVAYMGWSKPVRIRTKQYALWFLPWASNNVEQTHAFLSKQSCKIKSLTYIVLCVDDLLLNASQMQRQTRFPRNKNFILLSNHLKLLGSFCMDVRYLKEKGRLMLIQIQFISKLVSKFQQNEAYAVRNPICAGQDLTPNELHPALKYSTSYRRALGSLPYIANASRPDISYAISWLSQYLDTPQKGTGVRLNALYTISWKPIGRKYVCRIELSLFWSITAWTYKHNNRRA